MNVIQLWIVDMAAMNQSIPPRILPPAPRKKRSVRIVSLAVMLCLRVLVLALIVIPAIMGVSMFALIKNLTEAHFTSYTDSFRLTLFEVKSEPNYFTERVPVQYDNKMKIGIAVADLKEAGFMKLRMQTVRCFIE